VVWGLRLKHMDGESTDVNKHYSVVHSQLAVGELGQQSLALDFGVDLRLPVLDTSEQLVGWVEGPALGRAEGIREGGRW